MTTGIRVTMCTSLRPMDARLLSGHNEIASQHHAILLREAEYLSHNASSAPKFLPTRSEGYLS